MLFSKKPGIIYFISVACQLLSVTLHAYVNDYESALKLMKLKEYSIITKTDTIYFLATLPGKQKKTIVFCQGSGPTPMVINLKEGLCNPFPFTLDSTTRAEYNIVLISKPGLKRYATDADLNSESIKEGLMLQLDSMNMPPQKYKMNNSLYKLGGDCIEVIRFLKKQPWVDKNNIYVYGHSQGAVVAAYVAAKAPRDIKGLIYSQGNAYGIHAGYLSAILYNQYYLQDINKKMDSVYKLHNDLLSGTSDKEMNSLYGWKEKELYDQKNNDFYDLYTSRWRSLEEPIAIEYLLKIKAPILVVLGLNSPGDLDNKNIPLDFARHHKHNLSTLFYSGYDHNFFKQVTDDKGNQKEPGFHWDDVFNDVKKWIREVSKA